MLTVFSPDGSSIVKKKDVESFLAFLEAVGPQNVLKAGFTDIVSDSPDAPFSRVTPIGKTGYYASTKTDSKTKARQINAISEALGLGYKAINSQENEKAEKATGGKIIVFDKYGHRSIRGKSGRQALAIFLEVISEDIGLEKVAALNIKCGGYNIVSTELINDPEYRRDQTEILNLSDLTKWYVLGKFNTGKIKKYINDISDKLNLGYVAEIYSEDDVVVTPWLLSQILYDYSCEDIAPWDTLISEMDSEKNEKAIKKWLKKNPVTLIQDELVNSDYEHGGSTNRVVFKMNGRFYSFEYYYNAHGAEYPIGEVAKEVFAKEVTITVYV